MKTFTEFYATENRVSAQAAEDMFGIDAGYYENPNLQVFIYADTCYITRETATEFGVQIERDEYRFSNKMIAARHLYLFWYTFECETPANLDEAAALYNTFLDHHQYGKVAPHKLLRQLEKKALTRATANQIDWLSHYIERVTNLALEAA